MLRTFSADESKTLLAVINKLISESNSYANIYNFFMSNEAAKDFYNKARDNAIENNCQSESTIIINAIELMLSEIEKD